MRLPLFIRRLHIGPESLADTWHEEPTRDDLADLIENRRRLDDLGRAAARVRAHHGAHPSCPRPGSASLFISGASPSDPVGDK